MTVKLIGLVIIMLFLISPQTKKDEKEKKNIKDI